MTLTAKSLGQVDVLRRIPVRLALAFLLALTALVESPGVLAQTWPTKPVKVIAVFPPGGSVDQVARILAQQMSIQTGQSFIVDNRGGASGSNNIKSGD